MNSRTLALLNSTCSNKGRVQEFKNEIWQKVKGQELKSALHLQNNYFIQKLKLNWVFLNKCDLSLFGLKWKHIWKWKYPKLLQINAAICAPMSPRRYNELSDAQVSVEPSVSNSQLAWSAWSPGSQRFGRFAHFTQLWILCSILHILHNLFKTRNRMHNFSHFAQLTFFGKVCIFCTTLHILHNYEYFAQFRKFSQFIQNFAYFAQLSLFCTVFTICRVMHIWQFSVFCIIFHVSGICTFWTILHILQTFADFTKFYRFTC